MKLESNLPERPGLLHVTPVFDIFALLLLFFLLGPSFVLQSGIRVDPPPSQFQLERFEETLVVNVLSGALDATPVIYLGTEPVGAEELAGRLESYREAGMIPRTLVILRSDENTPVKFERELAEEILAAGFRLALAGRLPDSEPETETD